MTDLQNTKLIKLPQGKFAIVDDEDYERLSKWKWHTTRGYAKRNGKMVCGVKGKHIYMHRDIMQTPDGYDTDHINGDILDNRRCNLRVVSRSQNLMNQKPQEGRSSQFKGVCWHKRVNKWMAYIKKDGKRIYLGYYDNEDNAAKVYNQAAVKLHGHYARINSLA